MPWAPKSPHKPLPAPARVPDWNALRYAVLQASWQRDRWVSQRRLAWRWCLYYAGRYGLWIALLAAGAFWMAFDDGPVLVPNKPEPPASTVPTAAAQPDEVDMPLTLTAADQWGVRAVPPVPLIDDDTPTLALKPDELLYSLEP
jgi:hypothetical protein